MVEADVIYKIKQSNGTVTKYEEKSIEADTYEGFLGIVEGDMRKLREKLGRKVRLDIQKFKRDKEVKSKSLKAKESISFIKKHSEEDVKDFISEDEDRVTVLNAYREKLDIEEDEEINNK